MFIFLYDNLNSSKDEEEHAEHLRMVLQVLREHQLYPRLRKFVFYQRKIQYLGHVISEDGMLVNLEKIKAIVNWPTPKYVTNI